MQRESRRLVITQRDDHLQRTCARARSSPTRAHKRHFPLFSTANAKKKQFAHDCLQLCLMKHNGIPLRLRGAPCRDLSNSTCNRLFCISHRGMAVFWDLTGTPGGNQWRLGGICHRHPSENATVMLWLNEDWNLCSCAASTTPSWNCRHVRICRYIASKRAGLEHRQCCSCRLARTPQRN